MQLLLPLQMPLALGGEAFVERPSTGPTTDDHGESGADQPQARPAGEQPGFFDG